MGSINNKLKGATTAHCLQCGSEFKKTTALNDFCSLKCKRARANQLRSPKVRVQKVKPIKQVKPQKTVLNQRNPKNESVAIAAMIELNRNAPVNDREVIQKKNIVSPDLSKIEFKIYDKQFRIMRYFTTEEKYRNYLKNN